MEVILKIISLFGRYTLENSIENFESYETSVSIEKLFVPTQNDLDELINNLPNRDTIKIVVTVGADEGVVFHNLNNNYQEFFEKLSLLNRLIEDEKVLLTISIIKNNTDNFISVYSLDNLGSYLQLLTLDQILRTFTSLFGRLNYIQLRCYNINEKVYTSGLQFQPISDESIFVVEQSFRINRIESIQSSVSTSHLAFCPLIPDDFVFANDYSNLPETITSTFQRIAFCLFIVSIYDITDIADDLITFKLNGYKSVKGTFNFKDSFKKHDYDQYYLIYNWIYQSGNLVDKLGLSRNIISLHTNTPPELTGDVYQSTLSSYKIYEKQNIKEYIEIRNKISDQLLDFNDRANKIIDTFASGFNKSALALVTFYITSFIIRVISKGTFENIFTLEVTLLSITFIIGSFIYYKVARWEVVQHRKRFVESYHNLKERYTDLLNEADFKRIVNYDKEFVKDLAFINDKLRIYSNMWRGFLIILFLVTIILFMIYNVSQLINTNLMQMLFGHSCNC